MASKSNITGKDRKQRLDQALRANLKRRKQVGKKLADLGEGEAELATRKAAIAPKIDKFPVKKD